MVKKDPIEGTNECKTTSKGIEVPTEDERVALNAMKSIKDRIRDLKMRLSKISASGRDEKAEEILNLEKEMAKLRDEWHEWEVNKEKAVRERMILLGHEER